MRQVVFSFLPFRWRTIRMRLLAVVNLLVIWVALLGSPLLVIRMRVLGISVCM